MQLTDYGTGFIFCLICMGVSLTLLFTGYAIGHYIRQKRFVVVIIIALAVTLVLCVLLFATWVIFSANRQGIIY